MKQIITALVQTVLLVEISGIALATLIWVVVSELHGGTIMLFSAESVGAIAILYLGIQIFKRALASESRIYEDES